MPVSNRLDVSLQLIRGAFQEVPALRITLEQAQGRWHLEPRDLESILETFVDVGFLRHSPDGAYFYPPPRDVATPTALPGQGPDRRQRHG